MRSDIARTEPDRILVRGFDLAEELIGSISLGDMAYLLITGRRPTDDESRMFNALLVSVVEHGLTPSVIAARLTHLGAPKSIQGAVAAGILGAGDTFLGSMEQAAALLKENVDAVDDETDFNRVAREIVTRARSEQERIPGFGHPLHTNGDPRAKRLMEIALETGHHGAHCRMLHAIELVVREQSMAPPPLNVTGAIAAIMCDMNFEPAIARGVGVIARSVGLIGHLQEEEESPIAAEIWALVKDAIAQADGERG